MFLGKKQDPMLRARDFSWKFFLNFIERLSFLFKSLFFILKLENEFTEKFSDYNI